MKERRTSRLLLIDPSNRVLLMKIHDGKVSEEGRKSRPLWVTPGGRMEEGETVLQAAIREGREETGQTNIEFGPHVYYGEVVLNWGGTPTLMKESFVVARTNDTSISKEGLEEAEKAVIQNYQWWTLEELASTQDEIVPPYLDKLMEPLIKGEYPASPVTIPLELVPSPKPEMGDGGR